MNSTFKLYLETFPSILLSIVGFYFFAAIRYLRDIPLLTYINFPACGGRCFFESMTSLGIAGQVNEESMQVLAEWKKLMLLIGRNQAEDQIVYRNISKTFQRSCQIIRCTAGSMYTFENSIVTTTVDNTIQLTCNLLVIYK